MDTNAGARVDSIAMSFRGLQKPQHGPYSPLKLLQHELARLEPDLFFEVDIAPAPENSIPPWVVHASYGNRVFHLYIRNPFAVIREPALQEYIVHRFQQALQLEVTV